MQTLSEYLGWHGMPNIESKILSQADILVSRIPEGSKTSIPNEFKKEKVLTNNKEGDFYFITHKGFDIAIRRWGSDVELSVDYE